jgi:hypothetical protein
MDAGLKDEDLIYYKAKAGNDLMVANRKSTGSIYTEPPYRWVIGSAYSATSHAL